MEAILKFLMYIFKVGKKLLHEKFLEHFANNRQKL